MPNIILLNDATYERADAVSGEAPPYPAPDGFSWHEIEGDVATRTLVMRNGELVEIDYTPPSSEQALAKARADRWAEAKAFRDARQTGGCLTAYGPVQTDEVSQARIGNASLAAVLAKVQQQFFAIDWTMADNSVVALDGPAMIGLGQGVLAHVTACQNAGTAIRTAIDAAPTPTAVSAIDISAGYPDA